MAADSAKTDPAKKAQMPGSSESTPGEPDRRWRRIALLVAFIATPLVAGLMWYRASDNPAWTLFRALPNWCTPVVAELSVVSPDGRYRAHVAQTTCALRFTETMVFITDAEDSFTVRDVIPEDAVLEIGGRRSLDAITWVGGDKTPSGRPILLLWLTKGSNPHNVHRVASHWRDVLIQTRQSQPAPGDMNY
jgi:hypothetical protein